MFIYLTRWFFSPSPLLPHRRVSHTSPATGHCLVKPLCWAPSTASVQWVPHLPQELPTWSLHEVWPWLCVPMFVDCHPKMIQPHSNATCSMDSTQKLHSKKLEIHIDTNNQQTTLVERKCYTEWSNVQDKFWLISELISCVGLAERLETTISSKPKPSEGYLVYTVGVAASVQLSSCLQESWLQPTKMHRMPLKAATCLLKWKTIWECSMNIHWLGVTYCKWH